MELLTKLLALQTSQCYKGKALKGYIREQAVLVQAIAKKMNLPELTKDELVEFFIEANLTDISRDWLEKTL